MSVTAVTTSAALLLVGQLQAQQVVNASSEAPAVGQVLALREQLGTAALAGDVALLKELLSSELVVSDPDNNIRRRDDLLSLFDKGEVAYRSTAPQGSRWGPGTTLLRRFTDVFRNEDGSWRLIIRQSTVFATE
jgi:hypothetical protein